MIWAAFGAAAAQAGLKQLDATIADSRQRRMTRYNNEQTLHMYEEGPRHQMEGLRRAGLNPMLAYQNLEFSGSTPVQVQRAGIGDDVGQAYQSYSSAEQTQEQTEQTRQTTSKLKEETRKAIAEADLSEHSERLMRGYLDAIVEAFGPRNVVRISQSGDAEALAAFARKARMDPELAKAGKEVSENVNAKELADIINMPAANGLMKVLQLLLGHLSRK